MSFALELEIDLRELRKKSDKAIKRNLMKSGAYVRTAMKRGLRKRKRISRPGERPSVHGHGGLRNIRFAWVETGRSVIVGVVAENAGDVPAALEHGGRAAVRFRKRGRRGRRRIRVIRARPFAAPALEDTADQLLEKFWGDSI